MYIVPEMTAKSEPSDIGHLSLTSKSTVSITQTMENMFLDKLLTSKSFLIILPIVFLSLPLSLVVGTLGYPQSLLLSLLGLQ